MTAVIGIDPSLAATGIAYPNGSTSSVGGGADQPRRLLHLYDAIRVGSTNADLAVVEDLPANAMGAGRTGMAQGVVRLALLVGEVPFVLVPPATLKKFATGSGTASKSDLRLQLWRRAELDLRDDNETDAWWLREIGLHLAGVPSIALPKAQTAILAKLPKPVAAA